MFSSTRLKQKITLVWEYLKYHRLWLFGGMGVGLVLVLLYRLVIASAGELVDIYPTVNAVGVSPRFAGYLEFDRPVNKNLLQIKLIPEADLEITATDNPRRISIIPATPLNSGSVYTLRVSGRVQNKVELTFTTGTLPGVDPGYGDPAVETAILEQDKLYPLVGKLPYWGDGFRIVQVKAGEYRVTLFGADEEERTQQQKSSLDWLTSQGVSPSTVLINWEY